MPTLSFKGKTVIENHHHTVPHHRLEFDAKLSVLPKGEKPSLDGNLIIEGDNLLALTHDSGDLTEKSLFDFVNEDQSNQFERAVALCLDRDQNVLWWYRNLVGEQSFAIQGYKRHRLRPDFLAQSDPKRRRQHVVWVVESKGAHLQGSTDTQYKRDVAAMFSDVGRKVTWQRLGEDFKDQTFCFHMLDEAQENGRDWKDELVDLLRGEV